MGAWRRTPANGSILASWGLRLLRVDCRRTRYSHHIDTAATGTDTDLGGRRGRHHHPNASLASSATRASARATTASSPRSRAPTRSADGVLVRLLLVDADTWIWLGVTLRLCGCVVCRAGACPGRRRCTVDTSFCSKYNYVTLLPSSGTSPRKRTCYDDHGPSRDHLCG